MTMTCKLCGKEEALRESHIFPKFIFKWMQTSGSRFFRSTQNPNIRSQDGSRERLLCDACEARFSTLEKYFSENIFYPYLNYGKNGFTYDSNLFSFLISIAWRVMWQEIALFRKDKDSFLDLLVKAEHEWRLFLLNGVNPEYFKEVHLFFTDIATSKHQPVAKLNVYLNRAVDGTIASNDSMCAVYSKFSRFIS